MAPRRPLPIGSASTHSRAGCAYRSGGASPGGESAGAGDPPGWAAVAVKLDARAATSVRHLAGDRGEAGACHRAMGVVPNRGMREFEESNRIAVRLEREPT